MRYLCLLALLCGVLNLRGGELTSMELQRRTLIQCGNLIYAGSQSSVCFADRFLTRVTTETNIQAAKKFTPVKLGSDELFDIPVAVFSGEGDFTLTEEERENFSKYLMNGGFVLASPGCSDKRWDDAFRRELSVCFPDHELQKIPMDHALFSLVYEIPRLTLRHGGTTMLEGLEIDGRMVLVYSPEGLNDVRHAKGCCCCGGDEIVECEKMNVNIFSYALLY